MAARVPVIIAGTRPGWTTTKRAANSGRHKDGESIGHQSGRHIAEILRKKPGARRSPSAPTR
ncbi:DUF3140 domain-containing protein [Amycolatopsis sp. A133]|uniref:DUF3140 domain-containing protein n=1 Tax=Amycolatopsis sp. A133 TaxID=3064472 RepID=UPI0037C047F9